MQSRRNRTEAEGAPRSAKATILFVYWGRRGAIPQFTLELARAAVKLPDIDTIVSVSRQSENFSDFAELGEAVLPVDTFATDLGAAARIYRLAKLRRQIVTCVRDRAVTAVVDLMPHVWSPFVAPAIKSAGAYYLPIIHDADPHPGDYRSYYTSWFRKRSTCQADRVLTLSEAVADRIAAQGLVPRSMIRVLFHPDLVYGGKARRAAPTPGRPLRLLFLGRIMDYKGLPLFLDTVDLLLEDGLDIEVEVLGEGDISGQAPRLDNARTRVVNRWLTNDEITAALQHCDALVLSHIEASQSGVAAAAFGAGTPVIATPVGGLSEFTCGSLDGTG